MPKAKNISALKGRVNVLEAEIASTLEQLAKIKAQRATGGTLS